MCLESDSNGITLLIENARMGDAVAENQLCDRVFNELREVAHRLMRDDDTSLQPTMLVGDLFVKLFRNEGLKKTENRRYFFAVAANQMRNLLVDHYRRKKRIKSGGQKQRENLDVVLDNALNDFDAKNKTTILGLHDALERLEAQNERQYQVVMHRFFGGLSIKQTAELLQVSDATVEREWRLARAKLLADLNE